MNVVQTLLMSLKHVISTMTRIIAHSMTTFSTLTPILWWIGANVSEEFVAYIFRLVLAKHGVFVPDYAASHPTTPQC